MANVKFIAQNLRAESHLEKVRDDILRDDAQEIIISSAFAKSSGILLLNDRLQAVAIRTKVFVGIRNGITSKQALEALYRLEIETYCVDTGSSNSVFHPKVWVSRNQHTANAIIGSANMTSGGLRRNIESSVGISMNMNNDDDVILVDSISNVFNEMPSRYPDHLKKVDSQDVINELLRQQLIEDESIHLPKHRAPLADGNLLQRMPFPRAQQAILYPRMTPPIASQQPVSNTYTFSCLWESNPLSERDLNVPTGERTNATGSMFFKKGNSNISNFQEYFRNDVFGSLKWTKETEQKYKHYERASALFHIYISGVYLGRFDLRLSHNTNTQSAAFRQRNAMTSLHWGLSSSIIRNSSLLGRTLRLFRNNTDNTEFMIEID